MKKATQEVARINHAVRLKIIVVIENDPTSYYAKFKRPAAVLDRYSYNGNEYLGVRSLPLLILDIGGADTEWSPNQSAALNGVSRYMLITKSTRLIEDFVTKDLFFFRDNMLIVNEKLATEVQITVSCGAKTVRIKPCVVVDINNPDTTYEGVIIWINSVDNYAYMTFDEFRYFIWELERINLPELGNSLLMLYKISEKEEQRQIVAPPVTEPPPTNAGPPTIFNRLVPPAIPKI